MELIVDDICYEDAVVNSERYEGWTVDLWSMVLIDEYHRI